MNQIDHDADEVKIDRKFPAPWKFLFPIIALLWFGQWYFDGFDWGQIALGFMTGGALALWAIEVTGNKVPASWRSKTPSL